MLMIPVSLAGLRKILTSIKLFIIIVRLPIRNEWV